MTTKELAALIGKEALLTCHPLQFGVKILDTRVVFSRVDCLVKPIIGNGNQWVSLERLQVAKL